MVSNQLWTVVILLASLLARTLAEPLTSRQTYLANRLDSVLPASHSQAMRRLTDLTEVWTDEDATLSLIGEETETRANTITADSQDYPDIAALEDGGFVIVWESDDQDESGEGIFAQMFNADGTKSGEEFQVNTYTTDSQIEPAVASLVGGGFVVSWSSSGGDSSGYGIYAQIYDASGDPVATEIPVNTYMSGNQEDSDVTGLLDGGFLLAWTDQNGQDGSSYGIFAQRFDAIGTRVGEEFQVNTYSYSTQQHPSLSRLESGNVVITWLTHAADGSSYGIAARMYDETATAIDEEEFIVNTYTSSDQYFPEVAPLSGGGYIITWYGYGQNSDTQEIYAQRFDASSNRVGSEFQVNQYGTGTPSYTTVTGLTGGYFVITYEVTGSQDGAGSGVFAQVFDKQGTRLGDEISVNEYNADDQRMPRIATLQDGTFVITWYSNIQDASGNGIFFQMYDFSADSDPPTEAPTTIPTSSPTKSPSNPTCADVWSMIQSYTAQCSLSCTQISSFSAHAEVLPNEDDASPQDNDVIVSPGGESGNANDLMKPTSWSNWYYWSNYKDEILLLLVVMNAALMLSLCNMRRQSMKKYEAV